MLQAYVTCMNFGGPFYPILSGLGEMVKESFFSRKENRKEVGSVDVAMVVLPPVVRYIYYNTVFVRVLPPLVSKISVYYTKPRVVKWEAWQNDQFGFKRC